MVGTHCSAWCVQEKERPTIDSLVEQKEELGDGAVHLLPVQVEQGNDLEVHLPEQVGQLMDVGDGGAQLGVVEVVHVADQESDLVRRCVCVRGARGPGETIRLAKRSRSSCASNSPQKRFADGVRLVGPCVSCSQMDVSSWIKKRGNDEIILTTLSIL